MPLRATRATPAREVSSVVLRVQCLGSIGLEVYIGFGFKSVR